MGDVIPFTLLSDRWPDTRPGLRQPTGPWRAIDLRGRRPVNHHPPVYGPRGRAILATGQVWVEGNTQELYVIKDLIFTRSTFYPYDVVFAAYKRELIQRVLAEATFRYTMRIWDEFDADRKASVQELCDLAVNDPESPWRGTETAGARSLSFFGLDEDGYRID